MADTDLTPENITAIAMALGATDYSGHKATYAKYATEYILKAKQIEAEARVNQQFIDTIARLSVLRQSPAKTND